MGDAMIDKKKIQRFYDSYKAGDYVKHTSKYEQDGRLLAILSLVNLQEKEVVLDIGCGVGFLTRQYARLARGWVMGVDLSTKSINEAKNKAVEEGLDNLEFAVMDAEELNFKNDAFDCIICSEVIEHLPDPLKALKEINRVAKPQGQIVITTPNAWRVVPWRMVLRYRAKKQLYDQPLSPMKLNKLIKDAGLRVIKRRGTYYVPLLISPRRRVYGAFVRLSMLLEKKNMLPYLGLYQVCLLHPNGRL